MTDAHTESARQENTYDNVNNAWRVNLVAEISGASASLGQDQVSVDHDPTLVVSANTNRKSGVALYNEGPDDCHVKYDNSNVAEEGFMLKVDSPMFVPVTDAIYAECDDTGDEAVVCYWEV